MSMRIQADLFITNVFLDLVAENIDVAIRFGELPDSSLIAQRIGKSVRYGLRLIVGAYYPADRFQGGKAMKSPASKRPTPPKKETRIGKLIFVSG
jgi:hypothetical protein